MNAPGIIPKKIAGFGNPAWRLALPVAVLLAAGCGGRYPDTFSVHGKVTIDGRPVTQGLVMFYAEQGRPAMGELQPDGTYRLTTFQRNDGALPGKHRVTIKAVQSNGAAQQVKSVEDELRLAESGKGPSAADVKFQWLVPSKYADRSTSPLTAEVRQEDNEINFDLPSQ